MGRKKIGFKINCCIVCRGEVFTTVLKAWKNWMQQMSEMRKKYYSCMLLVFIDPTFLLVCGIMLYCWGTLCTSVWSIFCYDYESLFFFSFLSANNTTWPNITLLGTVISTKTTILHITWGKQIPLFEVQPNILTSLWYIIKRLCWDNYDLIFIKTFLTHIDRCRTEWRTGFT